MCRGLDWTCWLVCCTQRGPVMWCCCRRPTRGGICRQSPSGRPGTGQGRCRHLPASSCSCRQLDSCMLMVQPLPRKPLVCSLPTHASEHICSARPTKLLEKWPLANSIKCLSAVNDQAERSNKVCQRYQAHVTCSRAQCQSGETAQDRSLSVLHLLVCLLRRHLQACLRYRKLECRLPACHK